MRWHAGAPGLHIHAGRFVARKVCDTYCIRALRVTSACCTTLATRLGGSVALDVAIAMPAQANHIFNALILSLEDLHGNAIALVEFCIGRDLNACKARLDYMPPILPHRTLVLGDTFARYSMPSIEGLPSIS